MFKRFSCAVLLLAAACEKQGSKAPTSENAAELVQEAEVVEPPFEVSGEAEGLLLVWYDAEGTARTAEKRSEVPEPQRDRVRVDALDLPPERRLDPAYVFVADLRKPRDDGRYLVRKVPREAFEAAVTKPAQTESGAVAKAADVILYGASWCGACRQARQYLTKKGVPFVEKDIEKEPGARSEMLAKAKQQGVKTSGIPVIDVRGTLMGGFNPARIDQLLAN